MHRHLVRIGILGGARIAPLALINLAKGNAEVVVAAVAPRRVSRAQAIVANHGIARGHDVQQAPNGLDRLSVTNHSGGYLHKQIDAAILCARNEYA